METESLAIQISDLRVDYEDFTAVKELNLSVGKGEIFGLVGPNGAGKTSTFKVLATLMEPTYGEVSIGGIDILENPSQARKIFGYMQDLAPVPTDLKVWEFLDLFARAYGLDKHAAKRRVDECLEIVNLSDKRTVYCKALSRGMTQRVVLAKSLLHMPQVLLLDEPASGMDTLSRVSLRNTLKALSSKGVTVLISSHILTELSSICTQVGIINEGQILDFGKPSDVVGRLGKSDSSRVIKVLLLKESLPLIEYLNDQALVANVETSEASIQFQFLGSLVQQVELLKSLMLKDFPIHSFEEVEVNIENVVLNLSKPVVSNGGQNSK